MFSNTLRGQLVIGRHPVSQSRCSPSIYLPPPDLTAPEVVEWSKSLPPAQWAKRSPELARAVAHNHAGERPMPGTAGMFG